MPATEEKKHPVVSGSPNVKLPSLKFWTVGWPRTTDILRPGAMIKGYIFFGTTPRPMNGN
jgi:hypothetical protein